VIESTPAFGLLAGALGAANTVPGSLVPLAVQAVGTCLVFGLSVRLGRGGLGPVDLGMIALAGAGVAGWWAADEPVVATGCVIAADLVAALMMLPKTWRDPDSETLSTFVLASLAGVTMVGAVGSPSVHLLVYPVYFALVNAALAGVIAYRRGLLARSVPGSGSRALVVQ
jgi:hypothetical protein